MTIIYPPGQISLMGINSALLNVEPHIAYKGWDGSIFHLSGPLAPVLGAQLGVAMQTISGVGGQWTEIANQGARQDGATFQDAVNDPTEIDLTLETSSITAAQHRTVVRAWVNAWDKKKTGLLSWFTPELGEWWCNVRLSKKIPDQLASVWRAGQKFTWTAKNYDAYWQSFDSVSSFSTQQATASDPFKTVYTGNLGPNWAQTYTGTGGLCTTTTGVEKLATSGSATRSVININQDFTAATDNVIVTEQHANFMQAPIGGGAFNDLWARCGTNSDGTWNGNGVRARFAWDYVEISVFVNGVETVLGSQPSIYLNTSPPKVSLQCGVDGDPYTFIANVVGGLTNTTFKDTNHVSQIGPNFRSAGNGMTLGARTGGGQNTPSDVSAWNAYDNLNVAQSGFLPLTNIGSEDGWPRYLCYAGTGTNTPTFSFGDGPSSTSMISFGPLEPGQVVLVTTLPRLRSIVDLTPNAPTPQQLAPWQDLIKDLISFVAINDVPPLLQQFESFFGIQPPQGVLYSLLNGRFTNPIPGMVEGFAPVESHISVSIDNANPDSRVVAAVTPLRSWPE